MEVDSEDDDATQTLEEETTESWKDYTLRIFRKREVEIAKRRARLIDPANTDTGLPVSCLLLLRPVCLSVLRLCCSAEALCVCVSVERRCNPRLAQPLAPRYDRISP